MPSDASVMPNWHADRYSLRLSSMWTTRLARRSPASAISSSLARRARTSANSAATKKPLAKIRTTTALSRSAIKWTGGGRARAVGRDFEEDRRSLTLPPNRSSTVGATRSGPDLARIPGPRAGHADQPSAASSSIVAASAKSLSVMPPAECVDSVRRRCL